MPADLRQVRRYQNDFTAELARKAWYHSFELPDGTVVPGVMPLAWLRERWSRFPIPADLTGKRVLDIGAWDGWFGFEAERRGASVTSVDCVELSTYERMHRRLASKAEHHILDLYELPAARLGCFDITFCLGVLYHLKHPLLGLEIVCGHTTDVALIETFVIDGDTWRAHQADIPSMEFYELDELNGNLDNWVGPTVGCLLAMCRTAGFARVELVAVDRSNALVACHRKWVPTGAEPPMPPPELISVANATNYGINFSTTRDEYVTCIFRSPAGALTCPQLCLEIGKFGAPAVFVGPGPSGAWAANFRLPPGAAAGWNSVRLRLTDTGFSRSMRIAIDIPPAVECLTVKDVFDGVSWARSQTAGHLACWLGGLPENADLHNVRLWLDDWRLSTAWVGAPDAAGLRQVNAAVPLDCPRGRLSFHATCGGVSSADVIVDVL